MTEIPKTYDPKATEARIYQRWLDSGFFNPDICIKKGITLKNAEPFVIAMPPPNVTGTLHIGHVFEHALQDALVRYHRMRGKRTLWMPGTDHAAVATNAKYEKQLAKEGKSRHDFTREEYFEQVQKFALENQGQIFGQLKQIGDSVDWSRLAFTLDERREKAVRTAFVRMYNEGLIYRDYRIINWDPKGQTTISDDEIVYEETESLFYTFRYSKDFPISIATTRPETKVGDVAVAVHPDDDRYKSYVGKSYDVIFAGAKLTIKIIADKDIDPSYGTGAVGITPAHSMIDWEIAERHGLTPKRVINEYARMENVSEELNGKKTMEARGIIIDWLKREGLLEKEEKIKNNISKSDRTSGIIEPLPKLQWFIDVDKPIASKNNTTLKDIMRTAIEGRSVVILPENFTKIYMHWVENLRDWCISRQILYGHRIPVWYKDDEIYCKVRPPTDSGWTQDEDTLDTWFSSGLWTFSTLGWPDETEDLKTYHPTTIINPGYEILSLWVSRMIMMSGYLLGEVPFRTAYFHGMVRDKNGKKFSKSLNNGVDPLDIIKQYGADALRMSLIVGVGPGSDMKFDTNKVNGYKNFANKLWNIARFVLIQAPASPTSLGGPDRAVASVTLSDADQSILTDLKKFTEEVTDDMEALRLYMAAEKIYHYIWHVFADKIIEESKAKLQSEDIATKQSAQRMIREILEICLKLLHPFMPFVTESIWEIFSGSNKPEDLLMIKHWPV